MKSLRMFSMFLFTIAACTSPDNGSSIPEELLEATLPDYTGKADDMTPEELIAARCPNVEVGAPIPSYTGYVGLSGSYVTTSAEPAHGEPTWISFVVTTHVPNTEGTFFGWSAGSWIAYSGTLFGLADNAALFPLIALDSDQAPGFEYVFPVFGIGRWENTITALCLAGKDAPFELRR